MTPNPKVSRVYTADNSIVAHHRGHLNFHDHSYHLSCAMFWSLQYTCAVRQDTELLSCSLNEYDRRHPTFAGSRRLYRSQGQFWPNMMRLASF